MEAVAMRDDVVSKEPLFTVAEAAREAEITYQRIMYAIGKKWIIPYQEEPVILIAKSELDRYKVEHLNDN